MDLKLKSKPTKPCSCDNFAFLEDGPVLGQPVTITKIPVQVHNEQAPTFNLNPIEVDNPQQCELPVKDCSAGSSIACPDPTGFFRLDNLFGELRTEYEKKVARTNLGIGTDEALQWGNILGNLANQPDLVKFISEQIQSGNTNTIAYILKEIDKLNTQSTITTLYYGPSRDNLSLSNNITFTTGVYNGPIYVLTPYQKTTFIVNGLEGGFSYLGEQQVNSQPFHVFRSQYSNLGATLITVKYG